MHIKHTYTKTHATVWSEHKYMLKEQNNALKKEATWVLKSHKNHILRMHQFTLAAFL